MKFLPDAVEYSFIADEPVQAHNQLTYPIKFRITLPSAPMKKYSFGMSSFGFLYDHQQVIYIYLDYHTHKDSDTSYRINDPLAIEELLVDKLNLINEADQLDIDNNPFLPERQTRLIKKGKATILLYNILNTEYKKFLGAISGFAFIQP